MDEFPIQMTDHPAEAAWQWLADNINQFNRRATGFDDYRPLAMFIRDDAGAGIAGLSAFSWGGTLRILTLWVEEQQRRHGYGTLLLTAAEQEARTHGCRQVILETHSFQAPLFYSERGYTSCGVTEDYPVGFQQITFYKRLTEQPVTKED